jgi:Glycosyl hydrolase family 26
MPKPRRPHWTRLGVVTLVVSIGVLVPAAVLGFSLLQQAPANPLGVYGGEDPTVEQALAQSIGRQPEYAMAFLDGTSFQKMEDPSWFISQFQRSSYQMIWAVPILPSSGNYSLATGATGAYNQYFITLAEGLVTGGQGSSIIRLGWEFNGSWFPWKADGQAGNFIAYWRQIVNSMRSVPGADFKFEWNPTDGDEGVGNLADYYPGNSYVDFIGLDVYDVAWGSYPGAATEFSTIEAEPYGLNWLASFAAKQGKPMTLPEWGLGGGDSHDGAPVSDPGTQVSGGDDPTFINDMAAWIAAHNVYEATLWDVNESLVTPTSNPDALAAVAHDFGSS